MSFTIKEFDHERIEEASRLLMDSQKRYLKSVGKDIFLDQMQCLNILKGELAKDVAAALMVFDNDKIAGYMIAVIKADPHRGKSGWVNIGGWAVAPGYEESLPFLYREVAEKLVYGKILTHYILVFEEDRISTNALLDLTFAKEQTHAILNLNRYNPETLPDPPDNLELREATKGDADQIKTFSRVIAEHQTESPCFASAPLPYLKALDRGFSELPDDEEAEVFLALQEGEALGMELYYEEGKDILIPEKSSELCVGSVKEAGRGQGIGLALTRYTLKVQKEKGVKYIVSDWRCANLLSSRFWSGIGFQPTAHRLVRRIDPMILESEND